MPLEKKADFKAALPKQIHFTRLTDNEKHDLIEKDPLLGRVICRCETVTEGEIVAAIKLPAVQLPLTLLNAVPVPVWDAVRAVSAGRA